MQPSTFLTDVSEANDLKSLQPVYSTLLQYVFVSKIDGTQGVLLVSTVVFNFGKIPGFKFLLA